MGWNAGKLRQIWLNRLKRGYLSVVGNVHGRINMGRWDETMGWPALINTSKRNHKYGKIGETMEKTGYGTTRE